VFFVSISDGKINKNGANGKKIVKKIWKFQKSSLPLHRKQQKLV
jgi:hypothetical protein